MKLPVLRVCNAWMEYVAIQVEMQAPLLSLAISSLRSFTIICNEKFMVSQQENHNVDTLGSEAIP